MAGRWTRRTACAALVVLAAAAAAATATASFPGRNGRIAYVEFPRGLDDGGLFTIRPDGTDVRPVLVGGTFADPAWSPRGRWIAFQWNGGATGRAGVYVARSTGANVHFVARGREPTWSPDGRRLAYVSFEPTGLELAVVRRDGSERRLLGVFGEEPAWSPAGGRVAFVQETPPTSVADVAVLRLRDGVVTQLTHNTGFTDEHQFSDDAADPDWSPDGTQIAFAEDDEPVSECFGQTRIHVIGADGSGERILPDLPGSFFASHPTWAPNGSGRIAFGSSVEEAALPECGAIFNGQIASVSPEGLVRAVTTTDAGVDRTQPAWRAVPER